jgi:hypothetical protein
VIVGIVQILTGGATRRGAVRHRPRSSEGDHDEIDHRERADDIARRRDRRLPAESECLHRGAFCSFIASPATYHLAWAHGPRRGSGGTSRATHRKAWPAYRLRSSLGMRSCVAAGECPAGACTSPGRSLAVGPRQGRKRFRNLKVADDVHRGVPLLLVSATVASIRHLPVLPRHRVDHLPHGLGEGIEVVLALPAVNNPQGSSGPHSRTPACYISLGKRWAAAILAGCCPRTLADGAIPVASSRGRNAGTSTYRSRSGDQPGRRDPSASSRWSHCTATWGLELRSYTRVQGSGRRLFSWRHSHAAADYHRGVRAWRRGARRRRNRR